MKTASPDIHEGGSVAQDQMRDAVMPWEKHRRRRSVEGELPMRKRFCNSKFDRVRGISDEKSFIKTCSAPGTPKDGPAGSIWGHFEIEDVVKCWQRLAQQGCPHSQYSLALCFERGHGVKHDMRSAAQLWKSAAETGHTRAQYELGRCYEKGAGVERDSKMAIRWWREAADQGMADAQHKIGVAYELGEHVPKDLDNAVRMYRLAACQDHPGAQFELARCWEQGLGLPKDKDEANRLFRIAASKGHLLARMSALYT